MTDVILGAILGSAATILVGMGATSVAVAQYRKQKEDKTWKRITKANKHLRSNDLFIREQALNKLKRLAINSKKNREYILETINSFIKREVKRLPDPLKNWPSDVEAANQIICSLLCTGKINYRRLSLNGACLKDGIFNRAHLSGVHFEGANFENVSFVETYLNNAHFEGAHFFNEVSFESAHLRGTQFKGAHFSDVKAKNKYHNKDFRRARLNRADFSGVDLAGAWFNNARLIKIKNANFNGADLNGACRTKRDIIKEWLNNTKSTTIEPLIDIIVNIFEVLFEEKNT